MAATQAAISGQLEAAYRMNVDTSLYAFVRASSDWRANWAASAGIGVRF